MSDALPEYPHVRDMTLNELSRRIKRLKKYLELHDTSSEEWKYFDLIEELDGEWRETAEALDQLLNQLSVERERI